MPYLKNLQSTVLTLNIPITGNRIILFPNEVSEEITDEESLAPEVQRAVRNRAVIVLTSLETAYVCSPMVYKGLVRAREFPTNPEKGWVVVASESCVTPERITMDAGWVAMYTGSSWFVYCGNIPDKCDSGVDIYTILMLHCDGVDGTNVFTDSSTYAHAMTAVGSAQIDTAAQKFGTGAMLLGGSGDSVSGPVEDPDFDFGSGDFCIDLQMRKDIPSATYSSLLFIRAAVLSMADMVLGLEVTPAGEVGFIATAGVAWDVNISSSGHNVVNGSWHHVMACRKNTNFYLFVDGILAASGTSAITLNAPAGRYLSIGTQQDTSHDYRGWIDELRISKGSARIDDPNDMLYIASGIPADGFTAPICAYGGA
jgi:hypothetical protein